MLFLWLLLLSSVYSADSQDVEFLTNLVQDYNQNTGPYGSFLATASDVPSELTHLASLVGTYTDDSYTTMLDDDQIEIEPLESFASELPWHQRLQDGGSGSGNGSSSSSTSTGSSSSTDSSSADAGVGSLVAPIGGILGCLCVGLL